MSVPRSELVTTALLGTDRRGASFLGDAGQDPDHPTPDPAAALLDHAARSAVAQRAGVRLPREAMAVRGPADELSLAPEPAQLVLGRLLVRPLAELVNLWLAAAAERRLGAAPQHWTALAALGARSPTLDRALLGQVLGARGRWFLTQNAAWARLATAVASPSPAPAARSAAAPGPVVDRAGIARDPELVFALPDPWPREVVDTVLTVIASGALLRRAPAYATAVGLRLPLDQVGVIGRYAEAVEGRLARDAFLVLDRTVSWRAEIEHAFAPEPQESP